MKSYLMKLFTFLLVILGFGACTNEEYDGNSLLMYGTPTSEFRVKGKVMHATEKDKPLEDIRIVIYPLPEEYGKPYADTLFTDKNGLFELNSGMTGTPKTLRIIYEEQEEKIGEIPLKKGQVDVIPQKIKEGDGAWKLGMYEAEVNIRMEDDIPFMNKE